METNRTHTDLFRPLLIACLLFAIAIFLDKSYSFFDKKNEITAFDSTHIKKTLHHKEKKIIRILDELSLLFGKTDSDSSSKIEKKNSLKNILFNKKTGTDLYKEGIHVLIYENDTLNYWTSNQIPIPPFYSKTDLREGATELSNGFYEIIKRKSGNTVFLGFIQINSKYKVDNDYLENKFQPDFEINSNAELNVSHNPNACKFHNLQGKYLFSISQTAESIEEKPNYYAIIILYFGFIIFFLLFIHRLFRQLFRISRQTWWVVLVFAGIIFVRYIFLLTPSPSSVYTLEIFYPSIYANSFLFPLFSNLADSFINLLIIFLLIYNFHKEVNSNFLKKILSKLKWRKRKPVFRIFVSVIVLLLLYLAEVYFCFSHFFFRSIIIDSKISFEVYDLLNIKPIYAVLGFLNIALLFASFFLLTNKLLSIISETVNIFNLLFVLIPAGLFLYPILQFFNSVDTSNQIGWLSLGLMYFLFLLIALVNFTKTGYRYHFQVLIVFIFSIFTLLLIISTSIQKERNQRILSVGISSSDRDALTEFDFISIDKQIAKDSSIATYFSKFNENYNTLHKYLKNNYLNKSNFNSFEIVLEHCTTNKRKNENIPDTLIPCYKKYLNQLDSIGEPIPDAEHFYFVDVQNKRLSYFAWFTFYVGKDSIENSLFIYLYSRLNTQGTSYPELLVDKKINKKARFEGYSYARYKNNYRIYQHGTFPYNLTRDSYDRPAKDSSFLRINNWNHYLHNYDERNSIIIGKKDLTYIDMLVSFSYIFVFFYFLMHLFLFLRRFPGNIRQFKFDLKFRIQYSMITVSTLSLLVIGGFSLLYNIKQYQNKHYELIRSKMRAFALDFSNKAGMSDDPTKIQLPKGNNELDDYLAEASINLGSYIHLYDKFGNLIASTQWEFVRLGLTGSKMDNAAHNALHYEHKAEFFHNETIGEFNYLSAYVPVTNQRYKTIAYLNFPSFSKEGALGGELSTYVVAMINVYALLLMLAIVIAVFISNKILQPLRLVQSKIREFQLGKKNEQILYVHNDEIGSLIKEYNRMLVELEESADLLARSEREGAWREMAKQIAHEIKNPLTPMKLSVQLLMRSWYDKDVNFESRLKKVAFTITEQIDRLTNIATGFSNFAKIPQANNQVCDLLGILNDVERLFESNEEIDFSNNFASYSEVLIYADKEQLSRGFINLVKNATQAMRDNVRGEIRIELHTNKSRAIVKIIDNGTGIPPETQDKLFRPNFTTKSSGMGLGLSIVKNIIQNADGRIWFETEVGEGTIFYVQIPLFQKEEHQ